MVETIGDVIILVLSGYTAVVDVIELTLFLEYLPFSKSLGFYRLRILFWWLVVASVSPYSDATIIEFLLSNAGKVPFLSVEDIRWAPICIGLRELEFSILLKFNGFYFIDNDCDYWCLL